MALIGCASVCRRRCLVPRPSSTSPPRRRTAGGSPRRLVSRFISRCASHRPTARGPPLAPPAATRARCRSPCSSRWSRSRRRRTPIWPGRPPPRTPEAVQHCNLAPTSHRPAVAACARCPTRNRNSMAARFVESVLTNTARLEIMKLVFISYYK